VADLKFNEKQQLEKLFGMGSGYVLSFSNHTLQDFVSDSVGVDIYDEKYKQGSGSKANCLRAFWRLECNGVVGKLVSDLVVLAQDEKTDPEFQQLANQCQQIANRLSQPQVDAQPSAIVFFSYGRPDLDAVRTIVGMVNSTGLHSWFDKQDLMGGQDWQHEIRTRIRAAKVFVVCLSSRVVNRKGFFHTEMRYALDEANALPKGAVFAIPVRLDNCEIPEDLQRYHALDLFESDGTENLLKSLASVLQTEVSATIERHENVREAIRRLNEGR
jgi:hypothetical protein